MPQDRLSVRSARASATRLLLVLGLSSLAAACSGGSDDAGDTTVAEPSTTRATAPITSTSDAAPTATSVATSAPSSTASTAATSTTSTTSSTTTTTEPPPPPEWTVSSARLESHASEGLRSSVAAGVSATGDQRTIVVGAAAPGPGQPDTATAWVLQGGEWIARPLNHGDAAQSFAFDVARRGNRVVIVGMSIDDKHVGASTIWVSNDGGDSFGAANVVGTDYSRGVAVALTDARLFVVEELNDGSSRTAQVRVGPADDATIAPLPMNDGWMRPDAYGAVASDDVVVITGQVDDGERDRAVAWYSTDNGQTFALSDDEQLAGRLALGSPVFGGDGVIAMSSATSDGNQTLMTSANGRGWRTIPLTLTRNDVPFEVTSATPGSVATTDTGYVLGVNALMAATANVDHNGAGTIATLFNPAYTTESMLIGTPLIVLHNNSVYAFADAGGGTMPIAVASVDDASAMSGQRLFDGASPEVVSVAVYATSDRLAAVTSSYPHTTTGRDRSISWASDSAWSVANDGSWAADDDPDLAASSLLVGNGDTELIVNNDADDPSDVDTGLRYSGGAAIRFRADGGWGEPTLILSGPGSDAVADAAPVGEGFVFVGAHREFSSDGVSLRRPALAVVSGDQVRHPAIDGVTGVQTTLTIVAGHPSGRAVAVGTDWSGERGVAFAIERDPDGTWSRTNIDLDDPELRTLDIVEHEGALTIVGVTETELLLIPTDGSDRTVIPLPRDNITINAAVALGDRLIVVGRLYTMSSSRVAVWEVVDGDLDRIQLDSAIVGSDISVVGAVANSGAIHVAGAHDGHGIVWSITPPPN